MMRLVSRLVLTVPSQYLANRILAQKTFHNFVTNGNITSQENKYETPFSNYESFRKYGLSFVSIGMFGFTVLSNWKNIAYADDSTPHEEHSKEILEFRKEEERGLFKIVSDVAGSTSLGGLLGFSAGFAMKKVGKVFVFGIGALFVIIQLLASSGYLNVNWTKISQKSEPHLTKEGQKKMVKSFFSLLTHDFPLKAGLVSGFILGWKWA